MIKIKNAFLEFDDKVIFENLTLNIEKGEKIIVKAPSGRGKSTFLKVIMGFQKLRSGEVFVKGLELNEKNINEIREQIAYLPQSINFRNATVEEVIENIFSFKKNKNIEFSKEKLETLLEKFYLNKEILKKQGDLLSGGERQRVALVISFLMNKKILLLDESIASLDGELKMKVVNYLSSLDSTVILVTHDTGIDFQGFKVIQL